ncbi:predicted protein [Lodderomyces elongisporus NRRL YB-4239]|uniref:Uncharacterized protein n=1 Tax=Lodderomyces elongisporus (strain ATCC 11503 / CBS 2605 / JCM 1781 / NBRC 1676 / NRRL YB-4239) TaxID=379508 RepID=A5E6S8_LODEL|nr:predicted protein [Lodderomyces elongisporus NRRL YB-4239]
MTLTIFYVNVVSFLSLFFFVLFSFTLLLLYDETLKMWSSKPGHLVVTKVHDLLINLFIYLFLFFVFFSKSVHVCTTLSSSLVHIFREITLLFTLQPFHFLSFLLCLVFLAKKQIQIKDDFLLCCLLVYLVWYFLFGFFFFGIDSLSLSFLLKKRVSISHIYTNL